MDKEPFRFNYWAPSGSSSSFLSSGAMDCHPNPATNRNNRTDGDTSMSGNDSGSRSGTATATGAYTGNDDPSSFYGGGATPPISMTSWSLLNPNFTSAYNTAAINGLGPSHNRGSTSGPSQPGLLSPFAPAHHSSIFDVINPAVGAPIMASPSLVPPHVISNVTKCHCALCSDGSPAICYPQQLARQRASIRTLWEAERTRMEVNQMRVEELFREEGRLMVKHSTSAWAAENEYLRGEIIALRERVEKLKNENLQLRNSASDQVQGSKSIIHHGSFQANTPLLDGSPPSPMANRQSGAAGSYNSKMSAPPSLPSTRISMSPQPGHGTFPFSPVFSPCLKTETPSVASPVPARSPKRPISVIDVNELDPRLEGISLRASAVRKTTFAETSSEGAPPSKRRRSLSHDYYIVTNLKEEDEETDKENGEGEGEEEERRLTMYAGYTPNHSPSLPTATVSGPSGGSATPTASSPHPESNNCFKTEVHSAAATTEASERSTVSYPDLSHHLRRVETSSPSCSCSQGTLSEASGDAPLKGPLMIKNIPAQDELFLAALNERLHPISQGQDALPRAVQAPVAMPAPLSAVCGVPFSGADANRATVPDNTDVSGTQSDADEEHDGVHIKVENIWPFKMDDDEEEEEEKGHFHAKIEQPAFPIKGEDSDDEGEAKTEEPELPIKFRSTSNFGAPFGRM